MMRHPVNMNMSPPGRSVGCKVVIRIKPQRGQAPLKSLGAAFGRAETPCLNHFLCAQCVIIVKSPFPYLTLQAFP